VATTGCGVRISHFWKTFSFSQQKSFFFSKKRSQNGEKNSALPIFEKSVYVSHQLSKFPLAPPPLFSLRHIPVSAKSKNSFDLRKIGISDLIHTGVINVSLRARLMHKIRT
jgi:hypothetical protein